MRHLALATLVLLGCPKVPEPLKEECGNGEDDDFDGQADCEDHDCDDACVEDCANGIDDDIDGWTDCEDGECTEACVEQCEGGIDEDQDGAIDCADEDCDGQCPEECDDDRDNDGDGATDCEDEDCDGSCPEECDDLRDNDGDGATDCEDEDCDGDCPEVCDDERDNDGDDDIDCADFDCTDACDEICDNEIDDDGDNDVDCEDEECDGGCPEDCDDGRDNDGDGLLDCEDADCFGDPDCDEDCNDGEDNDFDGLTDCKDDDCIGDLSCRPDVQVRVLGGRLEVRDRNVQQTRLYCGSSIVYQQAQVGAAFSVTGTVKSKMPSETAWNTCTWAVDQADFGYSFYFKFAGTGFTYHAGDLPVVRDGFTVASGCDLTTSWFLPQAMHAMSGSGEARGTIVGGGELWYHGAITDTNTISISTTAGTCSTMFNTSSQLWVADPIGSGETYEP